MEKRPSSDAGFLCSFEPPGAAEWRALAQKASAASAFRVPGWIEAWAESYLPQGRWRGPCRNLSVRNERDELVAIFPLARMKFGPFEFRAAAGPYFPTRGIVLTNRESAAAACSAIANFLVDYTPWRLGLRIGPVSDRDTAISAFAAALQDRGWSICTRKLGNSMIVDVPVDKAAFEDRLGGIIKRATYYERRMRRIGEVRIAEIRPSESEQWASVVDDAAAIEQNSWIPRENGTRLLSGADNRRFWTQAVADEVLRSSLTLWVLYFDGIPASFSLTLDAGETKFILANLYDERFKAYSTGTVLTFYVISRAIDQRCRWIDWGLGDSGYKKRWLAIPGHGLHDLIAFPPGPIGWICQRIMLKRFGFRAHLNGTTL